MKPTTIWKRGNDDSLKDIGTVFNDMAPEYTRVMDTMLPFYRHMLGSIVAALPTELKVNSIVDLGCGNGNLTALLTNKYPDAYIHLVDASEDMLEACKKRFGSGRMSFEQAMFQDLQLEEGKYDLATAGFSFHHLLRDEKPEAIAKVYRSLRTTGVFTLTDLFIDTAMEPQHSDFLAGWKTFMIGNGRSEEDWDWLMDHYSKYDRPDPLDLYNVWISDAGFERIDVTFENGPWLCLHAWK